jgi:nicotinamidase-related amidase
MVMYKNERVEILVIDPQNDFCDLDGSLCVGGAYNDMVNLAAMINRCKDQIDDIHCTLDMHHLVDIAHPIFWKDSQGNSPNPFTIITLGDIDAGKWSTRNPVFQKRATQYVKALADGGRYPLCIWPPHCLIGSWGSNVMLELWNAFREWEQDFAMVDYVTKGSNFWTEHYSAVKAEVPDPEDAGTQLNVRLIETLQKADIIAISGQALSHCVKSTIEDIAMNFGEENIKKFVLLEDTSSSVQGFEQMGIDFVSEMSARGMQVMKSIDFLR